MNQQTAGLGVNKPALPPKSKNIKLSTKYGRSFQQVCHSKSLITSLLSIFLKKFIFIALNITTSWF